jgi:hypothetical protein
MCNDLLPILAFRIAFNSRQEVWRQMGTMSGLALISPERTNPFDEVAERIGDLSSFEPSKNESQIRNQQGWFLTRRAGSRWGLCPAREARRAEWQREQ